MKRIILLLITIITFTNVSYASFPVVEKVSDQTTVSMTDQGLSSHFPYYANIWFYIWGIGVFILLFFFYKNLRPDYTLSKTKNIFIHIKEMFSGWRRAPWWLYLSFILLFLVFSWWASLALMPLLWMALYSLFIKGNF
jgi:hypothetical protein